MTYFAKEDLENRLGPQTVIALFDDDGSSSVNPTALAAVISAACARVDSRLSTVFRSTFPLSPCPAMVKEAAIEWGIVLAFRRKPEYLRTYWNVALPDLHKAAEAFMTSIVEGRQYLNDSTTEPTPTTVGGAVRTGDADNPTVPVPGRHWQTPGDY